ncbi:uncharacterized protein LOC5518910 isoform X1 [Nematostella vectensis]|uniref:uncharacterized protein LOC5518910 isoform X1 n=2 Tax=Nematostella vectensis TaxID=45351 RepID=UPI00207776FA|nr:uncharacterized protein LOC5518910 isoform X1 [Nematostella vectensis]
MDNTFDERSEVWIEPFSELLNCLFPMEWVFGDWYWWLAYSNARHSDPECFFLSNNLDAGSRVEGFCIPRCFVADSEDSLLENLDKKSYWEPDLDHMRITENTFKTESGKTAPIFTVKHLPEDPRYTRLLLTQEWKDDKPHYKDATYLCHSYILPLPYEDKLLSDHDSNDIHGPVRKLHKHGFPGYEEDYAAVFKYPTPWPEQAMEWLERVRPNGWPSPEIVKEIFEQGCHLAPVGRGKHLTQPEDALQYIKHPGITEAQSSAIAATEGGARKEDGNQMDEREWRLSFSVAENILGQNISPLQRYLIVLMKMLKKHYLPDVICSYHLKNLLFWECENMEEIFWRESTSAKCLLHLLDRLEECLKQGHLPQYMMPESNLFKDEDPARLAEAASVVADLRRNIVSRTVGFLKRIVSFVQLSSFFYQGLDLSKLLKPMQDKGISSDDIRELLRSLYDLFIGKYNNMISRSGKNEQDDDDTQNAKRIPFNAYQSVLARTLVKKWLLDQQSSPEEEFIAFVRKSTNVDILDKDFIHDTTQFLSIMQQEEEPTVYVPYSSFMQHTKEMQEIIAIKSLQETLEPVKDVLSLVKTSDLKAMIDSIAESFHGKIATLSMSDLEKAVFAKIGELAEKRAKADADIAKLFNNPKQ